MSLILLNWSASSVLNTGFSNFSWKVLKGSQLLTDKEVLVCWRLCIVSHTLESCERGCVQRLCYCSFFWKNSCQFSWMFFSVSQSMLTHSLVLTCSASDRTNLIFYISVGTMFFSHQWDFVSEADRNLGLIQGTIKIREWKKKSLSWALISLTILSWFQFSFSVWTIPSAKLTTKLLKMLEPFPNSDAQSTAKYLEESPAVFMHPCIAATLCVYTCWDRDVLWG